MSARGGYQVNGGHVRGRGKGASTLLMATAFPKSRFFGFDYHDKSVEAARELAVRSGVADRVTF
jgi:predicted O-methyltransferase YrrM